MSVFPHDVAETQGSHKPRKPGIVREFCKPGKVMEKSGNLRNGQGIFVTCHMVCNLLISEMIFACNV